MRRFWFAQTAPKSHIRSVFMGYGVSRCAPLTFGVQKSNMHAALAYFSCLLFACCLIRVVNVFADERYATTCKICCWEGVWVFSYMWVTNECSSSWVDSAYVPYTLPRNSSTFCTDSRMGQTVRRFVP